MSKAAAASQNPKKNVEKLIVSNKRATFDYFVDSKIETGIELKGSEVKSCREAHVQLVDSFASIDKGEMYLHKAHIGEFKQSGPYFNHIPTRKRKLLVHKREIKKLEILMEQKGFTLVPLRMYFKGPVVKVEIGVAKGKTRGDKRSTLKEKDVKREMQVAVRRTSKYKED